MKELYFYPTLNETIAKEFGIEAEIRLYMELLL